MQAPTNSLRGGLRLLAVSSHVAWGLGVAMWCFPRYTKAQRRQAIHNWSQRLLSIIGLQLTLHGQAANVAEPVLLLANHISWLDIYALNAVSPSRFVAKSDVRSWPVVGRLCASTETLFVDRRNKHDALRVNAEISRALHEGSDVALFPEGTTTNGAEIKPFHSSLLQAAIDQRSLIQPVYLRYLDAEGKPTTLPAYFGDISLGASLWKILATRGLTVETHFLPAFRADDQDTRRTLARNAETLIRNRHEQLRSCPTHR